MSPSLKYGKQQLKLNIPAQAVKPEFREPEYEIDKESFIQDLLKFLPNDPLKYKEVAVVISDKTRLCGYPQYLPWLTEALIGRGASPRSICFYIAYGTHLRQSEDESFESYGKTYREFRFVHHDCSDESAFKDCGTTKRGTPALVRKEIFSSTLLITFGAISHHYFAGYGGGRKLLFPGLASRKAVYHNHGLFLDRQSRSLASGCQPGKLNGNPLAEDLQEIDALMPPKISIHGILNASGKVCRLLVGNSYEHFLDACRVNDSYYRYEGRDVYDMVVASSGGYPKDINFIQAHKSVHHAAAFVKDGGRLIMLSECIDKIGSNYFMKYLEAGSFEAAFSMLENNYEGNGGTALSMMLKAKRIQIYMLTSLDEAACKNLGVTKIQQEDIQKLIDTEKGSIALLRNASILIKQT
ncbi:MAG: nickel-dependent lactate racemase [Bacteroidales bacterium]|nr:nickel-dependent lactate racemase [Bacteroidales bacterium]